MLRKLVPLAVAVALTVGCGKKNKDEAGGGGGGGSGGDPNATYTIKINETPKKGEKTEVSESDKGTGDANGFPLNEDKLFEYTETVLEVPDGATRATKLTRTYKKATQLDPATKKSKTLAIEGKTVAIEKKGAGYEFTVGGKALSPADAAELSREFNKGSDKDDKLQAVLPKGAVKVGETWTPGMDAIKKLFSSVPFPLDESKSKMTGKLTRAYTQDGKQWGTVVLEFDLTVDSAAAAKGAPKGGSLAGTIKGSATVDVALDGSIPDGTLKMEIKMNLSGKEGGQDLKITADNTSIKTVKSVK